MEKKNGSIIAIITMIFLFGMISFVTNLAAPIGVIWKNNELIGGSGTLGMMGNMMNFLAYLFMGIPAGKLLTKIGYKKTALVAIAVGFFGILVQFLSGKLAVGATLAGLPANFFIYLLGAFIAGFSVCMLNTVVNPMLNLLGGGGNRGNQLVQIGGTFNSLMATLTPMVIGALIGTVTKDTAISDVDPLMFIAMGIFAATFLILLFVPVEDPESASEGEVESPLHFRHFVYGVIAIFLYVGVEVGIPGTLNFYLSDTSAKGAGLEPSTAAAVAGIVAGVYWLLMLVGRFVSSFISGVVSSKTQLTVVSAVAALFVVLAIFLPASIKVNMPVFNVSSGFGLELVPMSALLLVLCGLCTSVMWGVIFNLAVEGLGKSTAMASGIFMTMVVGGGIIPLVQNAIADATTYMTGYWVIFACLVYILWYALIGSRPSKVAKSAE